MSTRSTIVYAVADDVVVHLYEETNDGTVRLEVEAYDDHAPAGINVVIPPTLVKGLTAVLRGSRHTRARGEGTWNPLDGPAGEFVLD